MIYRKEGCFNSKRVNFGGFTKSKAVLDKPAPSITEHPNGALKRIVMATATVQKEHWRCSIIVMLL